jgi:hypothetical protein
VAPAPDPNAAASPSVFGRLGAALGATEAATETMIARGRRLIDTAGGWVPDRAAIERLVVELPGQMVKAIEIFLVQTILTPITVAVILYALARGTLRPLPLRLAGPPSVITPTSPARPQMAE